MVCSNLHPLRGHSADDITKFAYRILFSEINGWNNLNFGDRGIWDFDHTLRGIVWNKTGQRGIKKPSVE